MIPGIDGSIGSIKPVAEGLAESREIVVVDYFEEDNPTLNDLVDEIYTTLKASISEPFYLGGQSIGTIAAAKLTAYELPIQKVALTCTFTDLDDLPLKISTFFMKLSPDWLYRLTSTPTMKYVCGPVGDGAEHPFFAASQNSDKRNIARRTKWQIGADFSSDLKKISMPLFIMMGEEDRFVPDPDKEIQKLKALFQDKEDFQIQSVPNAGHVFLPSQAIETAIESINQFLA